MRLFIDLTAIQVILFTRRLSFVIYVVLTLVLAGFVALTDSLSGGTGMLVVRVSNNILFFQLPLLALLISPLIVQNQGPRKDWLWTTPLELPLLVVSQFVGVTLVLCLTLALNGLLVLALLVLLGTIPADGVLSLYGYYLLLLLPVTLAAAGAVIALGLLARNTLVVTAAVAAISALTWLGLLMPTATLLTPLNFTLLTLDLNSVVGLGAERPLLLCLLLFYLGCIPPLLILATTVHTRLDRRTGWFPNRRRGFAGLAFLALVATGGAWQSYSVAAAQRLAPPPVAEQINAWEVIDAEQHAAIEKRSLRIETKMRLRNRSDEVLAMVELGLNPGLRVTAASAAGETVSSQRMGELIQLGPLPVAVAAGEEVELELLYKGVPILIREDYQLANAVNADNPVSFQRAYASFVDAYSLQWMRDSDWLAWPLTSGPHVAKEGHSLQISLAIVEGPFLSSGAVSAQTEDEIVYAWEKPPQLLIAGGAYRHSSSVEGEIWVGRLSVERTTETAQWLLRLRGALSEWLEPSSHRSYQAVELPYVQNLAIGGMVLGFSNEIASRFSMSSTSVTTSESSSGTPPVVEVVNAPAIASALHLAVEVARAWLSDQISWPQNELTKSGKMRGYSVTCEPPDSAEDEKCKLESSGGVNPQAPAGRWGEEVASQSDAAPLLQAFAVVIAHELVRIVAGDQAFIEEELTKWQDVALLYVERRADANSLIPPYLPQNRLPVGAAGRRHNCQLAHIIVVLGGFASQFGRDALADLIASLAQNHPLGGEFLTEEMTARVLQDRFGYEWPETSAAICQQPVASVWPAPATDYRRLRFGDSSARMP